MDYSQLGFRKRKRLQSPHTTRVRNKVGLLILRVSLALVMIGGFAGVGLGLGIWLGILENAPEFDISRLSPISPLAGGGRAVQGGNLPPIELSSFIVDQDGEVMERLHQGHNRILMSLGDIPQHLRYAFVAIEDERFFEHNGVDLRGIIRAIYVTTVPGRPTEGASTITQQLVKNTLEVMDNDFITKLQEQYLALGLERFLVEEFTRLGYEDPRQEMKNYILQEYLNIINLGRSNYGVQAASWFYYGICVSELNVAQAATIAAITQNPSRFPPDRHPENNWRRARLVLRNMRRLGFITDEEYFEARLERPIVCQYTGEHLPDLCPITNEQLYDADGRPLMRYIGYVYDTIYQVYGGGIRDIISPFDCFTDALLDQLRDDFMREHNMSSDDANHRIFNTGLRIYSTQNTAKQAVVDRAFLNESLWPGSGTGFSIEVTHQLTVFDTISQQRRHYRERNDFTTLEQAEAFVEENRTRILRTADEISYERIFKVPQPQGAFVLMDHSNGHVVAMRGIRGPKEGNRAFNRATMATRSPGSQMKPVVPFAVLFETEGMAPSTVIDDIPFNLPNPYTGRGWSPGNHWGNFRGLSTIRNAIYASGNVVSARAAADTSITHAGVPAMVRFLEQMGVTTLSPNDGAAIVLGGMTNGMRLIELAGVYATLANLGEFNQPILYTRVYDHEGNILIENGQNPQRVFRATTAYMVTHSMMDTVTRGTGVPANFTVASGLRGQIPVSGKTGTSQSNRDLGFVGYTPYFTAAFWIGNDNETPLHRRTREFHTPMWRTIMEEIHRDLPPRQFTRPPGIVFQHACLDSGHLATEHCRADPRGNRVRNEIFATGNVPNRHCAVHQYFSYCTESGMISTANCPYWAVHSRVGLVREQPIDDIEIFVRDREFEVPYYVRQGLTCTHCVATPDFGFGTPGGGFPWEFDSGNWMGLPTTGQQNVAGGATVGSQPPGGGLTSPNVWGTPATPAPTLHPSGQWPGIGVSPGAEATPSPAPTPSPSSDETDSPSPFTNPFMMP